MAISRYKNFGTVRDIKTNQFRMESFPPISSSELIKNSDIIIEISEDERIDKIASDYLGDGRYWWIICLLNDLTFPFGITLVAGTKLRIPASIDDFVNLIQGKIGR